MVLVDAFLGLKLADLLVDVAFSRVTLFMVVFGVESTISDIGISGVFVGEFLRLKLVTLLADDIVSLVVLVVLEVVVFGVVAVGICVVESFGEFGVVLAGTPFPILQDP